MAQGSAGLDKLVSGREQYVASLLSYLLCFNTEQSSLVVPGTESKVEAEAQCGLGLRAFGTPSPTARLPSATVAGVQAFQTLKAQ